MPKKSTTPYTLYTFRYDFKCDILVDKISKFIVRSYPLYAIFKEISDVVQKPHIQGKIGVALSLVQLRKQFKAEFPGVFEASNYSISLVEKPDEYDKYIAKEGNKLCCNDTRFTEEFIQEQVASHKTLKTAFESKKQKLEGAKTFTEKVSDDFIKLFPIDCDNIRFPFYKPTDSEKSLYDTSCEKLLKYILKRLGNISKVFDDNILQRMYNGVKNAILQADDRCSQGVLEMYKNRIQF